MITILERVKRQINLILKEYKTLDPYIILSNLNIIVKPFNTGDNVHAILMALANRHFLYIDNRIENPLEQQFLLFHELGHMFLQCKINALLAMRDPFFNYNKFENVADIFAVEMSLRHNKFYENLFPGITIDMVSAEYGIKIEHLKLRFKDGIIRPEDIEI